MMLKQSLLLRKVNINNQPTHNINVMSGKLKGATQMVNVREDLTGNQYGMFKVIEQTEDHVTKSGQHQVMWLCQCLECGNKKSIRGTALKTNKTMICDCKKKKKKSVRKMTEQEKQEWNELYEYVKELLQYDSNQKLSNAMVLRLKGLSTGKFYENRRTQDMSDYTYKTILFTFKSCYMEINRGLANKTFNNEMHKFNYIMKIVEPNINNVYMRMQQAERIEEQHEYTDFSIINHDDTAEYQRKTTDYIPKWAEEIW